MSAARDLEGHGTIFEGFDFFFFDSFELQIVSDQPRPAADVFYLLSPQGWDTEHSTWNAP